MVIRHDRYHRVRELDDRNRLTNSVSQYPLTSYMTFFLQMTSLVKPLSPTIETSSCKLHRRQVDSSGVVREVFLQLLKNHPYVLEKNLSMYHNTTISVIYIFMYKSTNVWKYLSVLQLSSSSYYLFPIQSACDKSMENQLISPIKSYVSS